MPQVLDSLVLELGLDSSKFKSGESEISRELAKMREDGERVGKDVESRGRKTADVILDIKREALGLLAIFVGGMGLKDFVGFVTTTEAATGRLAKTMDMSARTVFAWGGALEQVGGSAGDANSALKGLSDDLGRFSVMRQSSMLGVLQNLNVSLCDQNHNLKTSGQLWMDLSRAVEGMDPRRATTLLQLIPGANEAMINFALLGPKAMQAYIDKADQAWKVTQKDVQAAQDFQAKLSLIQRSATGLGASFLNMVTPAIVKALDNVTDLLNRMRGIKTVSPTADEPAAYGRHDTVERFGSPRRLVEWARDHLSMSDEDKARWDALATKWYGAPGDDEKDAARQDMLEQLDYRGKARADAEKKLGNKAAMAGYDTPVAEVEKMIRAAAAARGIDPEVAIAVAKSEGLYHYKSTVPGEESYGPFQLHYGGRGQTGALARPGLGDDFTRDTGKHAEDPSTIADQIAYVLDKVVRQRSWNGWYGWTGVPSAGLAGAHAAAAAATVTNTNTGGDTSTVTIGDVHIVAPDAKDGPAIARTIAPALQRSVSVGLATQGTQ